MLNLITNLVLTKRLGFADGEIKLFGTNLSLIPPQVYVVLLKELERDNEQEIIYESSKKASYILFQEIVKIIDKGKLRLDDKLDIIPSYLNLLSLGESKLTNKNIKDNYYEFTLSNSLNAELYGLANHPVDLQFSGLLAGAVSFILGKEFDCKEISCMSMGMDCCKFVLQVKK